MGIQNADFVLLSQLIEMVLQLDLDSGRRGRLPPTILLSFFRSPFPCREKGRGLGFFSEKLFV